MRLTRLAPVLFATLVGATVGTGAFAAAQECRPTSDQEIAQLFDRWNASLQTGDPVKVVDNYSPESVLLPTVSNKPRFTAEEKIDYFDHFLAGMPVGKIDNRFIQIDCNTAVDAGL